MNSYAVVKGGVVVNVIAWDGTTSWTPGEGETAVLIPTDQPAGIGWTYDGANFAPPAQ